MKNTQIINKVNKMISNRSTEQLISDFAETENNSDENIYTVRGWLMDELEKRNPSAFEKWLDGNCSIENLRSCYAL